MTRSPLALLLLLAACVPARAMTCVSSQVGFDTPERWHERIYSGFTWVDAPIDPALFSTY